MEFENIFISHQNKIESSISVKSISTQVSSSNKGWYFWGFYPIILQLKVFEKKLNSSTKSCVKFNYKFWSEWIGLKNLMGIKSFFNSEWITVE